MTRMPSGFATALLVSTALCATPAKADPITGWIIAGVVVNTALKAPFYARPSDFGPRYGYPLYGYPGYLRPGYVYAAYDGPGSWGPPPNGEVVPPPTTCYWTNKPGPHGMKRVRICY